MSKLKAIAIFIIAIIFVAMGVSIQVLSRKYKAEKSNRERLWQNNIELTAENRQYTNLLYSRDEFIKTMTDSLKTALNALKIKPKTIEKIIYRTITDIDTVDKVVFVDYRKTHWLVSDAGKCFTWSAMAFLSDTTLKVIRTDFSYQNGSVDYFYQSRAKKFLFIRYGKKKIRQVTVPVCGSVYEKTIEIIKE